MRVRFFGSSECEDCAEFFIIVNKLQVDYEYIDTGAEDDDIQDFCDEHNIELLPHIQFLDKNDEVLLEHIGPITEDQFKVILGDHFPNY